VGERPPHWRVALGEAVSAMDLGEHVAQHALLGGMPDAFPYISKAVHTRGSGLTFGDVGVDNFTRMQQIIDDAAARGKFVLLDHALDGPVCMSTGILTLRADMYGEADGPRPEFWLTGAAGAIDNCLLVDPTTSHTYARFVSRRRKAESRRISSYARDAAGIVTIGVDSPHVWGVGDPLALQWCNTLTLASGVAVLAVPSSTSFTFDSGVVGAALTFDPLLSVMPTRIWRRNDRLHIELPAGHGYRPGMEVALGGGVIATTQLHSQAGVTVNTGGATRSLYGITYAPPSGARLNTTDNAFPPETYVYEVLGSGPYTVIASHNPIATGSGKTVVIGRPTMNFQGKTVARATETMIVLPNPGPDDVVYASGIDASVRLTVRAGRQWAEARGNRGAFQVGYQFAIMAKNAIGHRFEDIDARGNNWMMDGLESSTFVRCSANDTIADGLHIIAPSTGRTSRHIVREFSAYNTGDDPLVLIGYRNRPHCHSEAVIEGVYTEHCRGRGVMVSGVSDVIIRSVVSKYNHVAGLMIEAAGTADMHATRRARIEDVNILGCASWDWPDLPATHINQAGLLLTGGINTSIDRVSVVDSHADGVRVTDSGNLRVRDLDVEWTYANGVAIQHASSTGLLQVDLAFDRVRVTDSGLHGWYQDAKGRGITRVDSLELADLGWKGAASTFGLNLNDQGARYELGRLEWRRQNGGLARAIEHGAASGPITQRGAWRLPRHAQSKIAGAVSAAINGPYWHRALGEDIVLVGEVTGWRGFVGDFPFTLTTEARERGFVPIALEVYHDGAPIHPGAITNPTNLDVRSAAAGGGVALFAAASTFKATTGNSWQLLGQPPVGAILSATNGSSILRGDHGRYRVDEILPGMGLAGTGVPGGATVVFTDLVNQRIAITTSGTWALTTATRTAGNADVTVPSAAGIAVGQAAIADGVDEGTTVTAINALVITLSTAPRVSTGSDYTTNPANSAIAFYTPANFTGTSGLVQVTATSMAPATSRHRSAWLRVATATLAGINTSLDHTARLYGRLGAGPMRVRRGVTFALNTATNADSTSVVVTTMGLAGTLDNPTGTPAEGDELRYEVSQNATGGWSLSWGSAFVTETNAAMSSSSGTANQVRVVAFRWSQRLAKWVRTADSGWTT
jgi:hypothetical protein